eukprot:TRINITY_DN2828_c0_g1_i1.p1 TRINITY_DN2828_c0_g1~~TRINITY_DN2828_c0_g1_i1.p1  ORF type:complete len:214 (-),score=30.55 TRINITY_DN2828_c0_g1_i1:152-793(-)
MLGLVFLALVSFAVAQPADYIKCRTQCADSCGKNGTACSGCVVGKDCLTATQDVCVPSTWKASACPAFCSYSKGCGVGCLEATKCGGTEKICVPNANPSVCGSNNTCIMWKSCDQNLTSGAVCCADGKTDCLPENTYEFCGDDCTVVEQKYYETLCHMGRILPLWQWILIACAAGVVLVAIVTAICCCCCKKRGKGPQSIEDDEWLMDSGNRW